MSVRACARVSTQPAKVVLFVVDSSSASSRRQEKTRRVGHDRPIGQCLVVVEKIDQLNIAIEIGVLMTELQDYALQLEFFGFGHIGHQAYQPERLLFCFGEAVDLFSWEDRRTSIPRFEVSGIITPFTPVF